MNALRNLTAVLLNIHTERAAGAHGKLRRRVADERVVLTLFAVDVVS